MKKTAVFLFWLICVSFCLFVSCNNDSPDGSSDRPKDSWAVTFVYNNQGNTKTVYVKDGETVSMPLDPYRENYVFLGWFSNTPSTTRYDFSLPVTEDIRLYAKFELNATAITNQISESTMKSIVKIECQSYNLMWGFIETDTTGWNQGSGFCIEVSNGNYYILTNCHVVAKSQGYDKIRIKVTDYKGNTYTAYLYSNPNKDKDAISAEYDLACIYFSASSSEIQPLKILSQNPKIGDDVIALGAPKNQSNTITFGKARDYRAISLDNTEEYLSNVTFDVLRHDANIKGGSSGGPLLNTNLEVIGVNYASAKDNNNISYAIPAEKVHEFLKEYVYN